MFKVEGKKFLLTGVANKKSIAYAVAKSLLEAGAKVDLVIQVPELKSKISEFFPDSEIFICDVQDLQQIESLVEQMAERQSHYHGLLHSIAFANYSEGIKPFHETKRGDFLQAAQISCFSLIELTKALLPYLNRQLLS